MDAGARLLIQLCQTCPLDFADFAIPDNALEGALEYLPNTNDHCGHLVLLEFSDHSGAEATIASQFYRPTF
jgi:hypothetical protein